MVSKESWSKRTLPISFYLMENILDLCGEIIKIYGPDKSCIFDVVCGMEAVLTADNLRRKRCIVVSWHASCKK